jgi:triosephosphate isomerase
MTSRVPVVGGNWKMNLDLASAAELADDIIAGLGASELQCDVMLFPPFPYLHTVGKILGHHAVLLGAQNVWPEANGAYTGEVSTLMLHDLATSVVLVGHSERRHVIGEDEALITRKVRAALAAELRVVLCVGETLDQRHAGQTETVVLGQVQSGLSDVTVPEMARVVIAYEPVWAIGTGVTATPDDAQTVHASIRASISDRFGDATAAATRIQYGGSVTPRNAAELFAQPDIDGGLIGGASLKADAFLAIVRAAISTT